MSVGAEQKQSEASIMADIMAYLESHFGPDRAVVRRVCDRFARGRADIQVIATAHRGGGWVVVLELEVKRPGGKQSAMQIAEQCRIRAATSSSCVVSSSQFLYRVIHSVADVQKLVRELHL